MTRTITTRHISSFFLGSLAGVSVDLGIFQLLISFGFGAFLSNAVSSGLAITLTYILVTRYTFRVTASLASFAGFAVWYACSITFFSWVIEYAVMHSEWPPLLCKIASLPFSFAVNFLFSHFFLGRTSYV